MESGKENTAQLESRIRECHSLALDSMNAGDLPFGALIELNNEVVARSLNTGRVDITGHAEINVVREFLKSYTQEELKQCTLYTNFEPCAMCSFIIRDYGIPKVVFSIHSPHLGGYSKWGVLQDFIEPVFTWQGSENPPQVIGGILEKECKELFDSLDWKMHYQ
jgi:tRNA(adenine34) deaminase